MEGGVKTWEVEFTYIGYENRENCLHVLHDSEQKLLQVNLEKVDLVTEAGECAAFLEINGEN